MVRVAGLRLRVLPSVFNPAIHFTSSLLASYLARPGVVPPGSHVLDLGTGSGIVALAAALSGAERVVATDINPSAAECARLNVRRYGLLDTISVRQGDLFSTVQGEQFDIVVCNPPYFRGEPAGVADLAFHAGAGLEWLQRFGNELHTYLKSGGSAIISLGDAADIKAILGLLNAAGWKATVLARRDILVEVIYLFQLTRLNGPHGS